MRSSFSRHLPSRAEAEAFRRIIIWNTIEILPFKSLIRTQNVSHAPCRELVGKTFGQLLIQMCLYAFVNQLWHWAKAATMQYSRGSGYWLPPYGDP